MLDQDPWIHQLPYTSNINVATIIISSIKYTCKEFVSLSLFFFFTNQNHKIVSYMISESKYQ